MADMYKLRSIAYAGVFKCTIKMEKNGDIVEVICEVKRANDSVIEGLDLISFEASRFDGLCISRVDRFKVIEGCDFFLSPMHVRLFELFCRRRMT